MTSRRQLRAELSSYTDRLWEDLNTTLRVRAERKAAEADAKVEERVSGLLKAPAPRKIPGFDAVFPTSTTGGLNSTFNSATNSLADEIADINARLDATETAKKADDTDRPEKAPQGITHRVDGKPDKKGKK